MHMVWRTEAVVCSLFMDNEPGFDCSEGGQIKFWTLLHILDVLLLEARQQLRIVTYSISTGITPCCYRMHLFRAPL